MASDVKCAVAGMDGDTPQQHFDARQEFGGLERLGHIVIRSQFESDDFIHRVISNGEDEYRRSHPGSANIAADVETAAAGKHQVQDDQVEGLIGSFLHGLDPVGRGLDHVPFGAQSIAQSCPQGLLIFHYKDAFVHSLFTWIRHVNLLLRDSDTRC